MEQPRNYTKELDNLVNALADSVLELSDDELLAEASENGEDIQAQSQEVTDVLRSTLKRFKQHKLIEAERLYEERSKKVFDRELTLPQTPVERRAFLTAYLQNNPGMGKAILTTQHRDFQELSDEDIESYLKQLFALGAFQNDEPKEPNK